jgi:drug/metabolite transporter (DMT)-like permease
MWLVPALWAGAFLTGASALRDLSPTLVAFLRFAITVVGGAALFGRPAWAVLRARPGARAWLAIGVLSLTSGVVYHLLFYTGLARTPAPVAAIIIATNPIFTTLGVALFLKGRMPTLRLISGLLLAFAGAVSLSAEKQSVGAGVGLGEALCLGASVTWAAASVLLEHFRSTVLKGLPSAGVTYLGYTATAALLLPLAIAQGALHQLPTVSVGAWVCLAYIGLISTVLAYTLFNAGVDRAGSARASNVASAVPAAHHHPLALARTRFSSQLPNLVWVAARHGWVGHL